jgi:endoglucanase Acf2
MKVGQLMTATEMRSTQKYWHVLQNVPSERIYNEIYDANVVGIIWTSMVQFGTWFGRAPFLPYGIQLLPLTPISEQRDDLRWANEMYYPFSKACSQNFQCTDSGWVVLQVRISFLADLCRNLSRFSDNLFAAGDSCDRRILA